MQRIKIVGSGLPHSTKIYLDDIDISRFVFDIQVNLSANQLPQVVLSLVGEIEIPDELLALVVANGPEKTCVSS